MKEAIGGVSLFNIVIVLVLIFTGYISLSINYSKAYNVKNEILNIIRNQGGVCTADGVADGDICYNFKEQITDYFQEASYRSVGKCDSDWVGYSRTGDLLGRGANNAAFCVRGVKVNSGSELPNSLYYQVKIFYQLDLPVINSLFEFSILGETTRVYSPNECGLRAANYYWCGS